MRHARGPSNAFGAYTACFMPLDLGDDTELGDDDEADCERCRAALSPIKTVTAIEPVSPKAARIAFLERKRLVTIEDTKLKLEGGDWHGVADGAMDLRDIDNELDGLRF